MRFVRAGVITFLSICWMSFPAKAHSPIRMHEGKNPRCLSVPEEITTNFSRERVTPASEPLPPNPDLTPPEPDRIREAIEAGFSRVPRKGDWIQSYSAARPARIYDQPSSSSLELGRMEPQTRLPRAGFVNARAGCADGWLRIGLSAYVCLSHFGPARELPTMDVLPTLPENSILPGQYAYVRVGGTPWYPNRDAVLNEKPGGRHPAGFYLQFRRFVRIGEVNYWRTSRNQLVPVDRIARHIPSTFHGTPVTTSLKLPLAFPRRRNSKRERLPVPVYDRPGGTVIGEAPPGKPLPLLGERREGRTLFYRVDTCRWIAARDVSAAFPARVPPGVRQGERWMDINLARQTLVAYVEDKPVYATVISAGKEQHPTKTGVFRVYWKVAETDMQNEVGADDQYLASSVPWSMFFWRGLALHGAYWHDDFGIPKSHGCINLAPLDARYLYEWSFPILPSGVSYLWSGVNRPGMVIQVRANDEDSPMVYGYARQFVPPEQMLAMDRAWEQRLARASAEIIAEYEQDRNASENDMNAPDQPRPPQRREEPAQPKTGMAPRSATR